MTAVELAARGPAKFMRERRDRLERERTRRQLERQRELEAEAARQGAPRLGPAGRPMSEAAGAVWRRGQVSAYLAKPPWTRAWLTWRQWGYLRRLAIALAVVPLWPVAMLPLRMTGLASEDATRTGVIVLLVFAPIAMLTPPWSRPRFAEDLGRSAPPWSGSRRAVRIRRALVGVGAMLVLGIGLAAWLGPGPEDIRGGELSAAAERADRIVIERTIAAQCGAPVPVSSERVGTNTYRVTVAGGSVATVEIDWPGRAPSGSGAGHGHIVGAAPTCP